MGAGIIKRLPGSLRKAGDSIPDVRLTLDPQIPFICAILSENHELREGNMAQGTSFNMEAEFAGLNFHSLRLEERFIRTMETLI
jgi:hypothetical protein